MMKYALFLFLFMYGASCSLPAAEKDAKVAALITLEEELKLASCERIRLWRQNMEGRLCDYTKLPTVLVELISHYIPDPKPTVIAITNPHHRYWQINRSDLGGIYFYLFTTSQNLFFCKEIYFSNWQRSQFLRESALEEAIAERLSVSSDYVRSRVSGNMLGVQPKNFERLGIDRNAVWCLKSLLNLPFRLVAKSSDKYQVGEKRSVLLLDADYTMYEWGYNVQELYEKIVTIQQSPDQLALVSEYDQDHLKEFVQAYIAHGAQFVQACNQIDENVGLLFGE